MSRYIRKVSPIGVYHWINRGIHKKDVFHDSGDYEYFRELLLSHKSSYGVEIYHYCLMTNHIHMLIKVPSHEDMSLFSQMVLRKYAYFYSKTHRWIGSVFQRVFKSLPVDKEAYFLECARYIERNPIKAGITQHPSKYQYSSYNYYALGRKDRVVTASPGFEGLSNDLRTCQKLYMQYVSETRVHEEMQDKGLIPS